MNELEIGFRTAMVGGFQRDDVLKYIEEMAQGHAKETEALKSKLDEIETERDALKKRIKGLTDEKNSLRQRLDQQEQELGQAKAKLETQKQELEQAKSDTDAHAGQYHDLQQQLGALQVEAGELRLQNDSRRKSANMTKRVTAWQRLSCAPASGPGSWSRRQLNRRKPSAPRPSKPLRKPAAPPNSMRRRPARQRTPMRQAPARTRSRKRPGCAGRPTSMRRL